MRKEDKGVIISQLADTIKQYGHFYLIDTTAMDAAKTSELRRKCFKAGIKLVVVKNSLLHKALMGMDVDYSPLFDSLKGTTSVMFSEVANAPAKLLKEYKEEIPAFVVGKTLKPFTLKMGALTTDERKIIPRPELQDTSTGCRSTNQYALHRFGCGDQYWQ